MSTQTLSLLCVSLFICASLAGPLGNVALPKNIKVCQRSEDAYSDCLTNAIQESWPTFVKGIPELESPILDPLKVEVVEGSIQAGQYVGNVILRDVTFYGLANTMFVAAQPEFTDDRIKLDLYVVIPKVFIECDYKAQGSIDTFNIGGKGHFNISMDNLTAKWTLDGHIKNDKWVVEHFRIDPEIKGMKLYFSDLLNGNKMLNEAAMLLANQYWPIFFQGMKPIIVQLSDGPLTNFVNRIVFSKVAVSKIFP